MRTAIYSVACSLDGFIAATDGGIDWLHFSKDVQTAMGAFWPAIDVIVMGRATWEVTVRHQPADAPATPGMRTYVYSRTLTAIDRPGVTLVREDPAAHVLALKERPGKNICVMGGGLLATALLAGGAVDEIALNVHPVLLGTGVPLFRDAGHRIPLALTESRRIDGGCVLSTYRVIR